MQVMSFSTRTVKGGTIIDTDDSEEEDQEEEEQVKIVLDPKKHLDA